MMARANCDAVADVLVPHLQDRPFTMRRYSEGIASPAFFQKKALTGTPSWIRLVCADSLSSRP